MKRPTVIGQFALLVASASYPTGCGGECGKDPGDRRFESGTYIGFADVDASTGNRRVDVDRKSEVVRISWVENGKVIVETHRVVRTTRKAF